MNLFKKAACFTDIHFGLKSGSRTHNTDCEDFVKWFCEAAKTEGCETAIFLGDWHHNRSTTDVSTMNYTLSNLERLSANFEKVYFILGNHDLFYKDKREINSVEFMRLFPNVVPIKDPFTEGNVTILPWLVADEWKNIPNHGISNGWTTLTYEEPCDYKQNNMERFYPVKDVKGNNRELFKKYIEISNPKMFFIGRLGMYSYLDMHQCINSALSISNDFLKLK